MRDGNRGEEGLIAACLALVQVAGTVNLGVLMVAPWAVVILWPQHVKQGLVACLFCCKSSLKFNQVHWLLVYCYNYLYFNISILCRILGANATSASIIKVC